MFRSSPGSRILAILAIGLLLYLGLFAYRTLRWKLWIWLPAVVTAPASDESLPDPEKHLIFLITDHYEPGFGEAGVQRNEDWLEHYRPIADQHHDSAGNRVQLTWFYPFEHGNDAVLIELNRMVYEGYGEVELHWHHPRFTNATFPDALDAAIEWFQGYGALISSGPDPSTQFAFIHGNWALDDSKDFCGVTRELEILQSRSCYADFTFSTIGTSCQPHMANQIYYVVDGPEPKSYDRGRPAKIGVGAPGEFMIFLGPLAFDWWRLRPEYGSMGENEPTRRQINQWIDADIHVAGRPDWVFVKAYEHGIQDRTAQGGELEKTLVNLEAVCAERGITLHYVTAREAFNLVKAAEAGETGNPELYRNYRLLPPANRYFHTEVPVKIERVTATEAIFVERE